MMKRLIPILLAAVLLLSVIAPAETVSNLPPPERFSASELLSCPACGILAANDPLFESNHAACEGCGLRNCEAAHARKAHSFCGGCGMRKCDAAYDEAAHMKCAGCREQLCASESDHSYCDGCKRYVCRENDHYSDYIHFLNAYGRWTCLDYPEEPAPEEFDPDGQPEVLCNVCGSAQDHAYCANCGKCAKSAGYFCTYCTGQHACEKADEALKHVKCNGGDHCKQNSSLGTHLIVQSCPDPEKPGTNMDIWGCNSGIHILMNCNDTNCLNWGCACLHPGITPKKCSTDGCKNYVCPAHETCWPCANP